MTRSYLYALLLPLLAACATLPAPSPTLTATVSQTANAELAAVGDAYWELQMGRYPTWATAMGDHRYDDRMTDPSEAAILAHQERLTALERRLLAIEPATLSTAETVTADILALELSQPRRAMACQSWRWSVDQLGGPHVGLAELARYHRVQAPADAWNLLTRYGLVRGLFDAHVANLRKGLAAGQTASKINVERVLRQLDELLATPVAQSPFVTEALAQLDRGGLDPDALQRDGTAWRAQLLGVVESSVYPGLTAYRDAIRDEVQPRAREGAGVASLPGGAACYEASIASTLGLDRAPDELHALGLAEVERIRARMETLAHAQGAPSADTWLAALNQRQDQHFESAEALLAYNTGLVQRAQAALPAAFGRLPKTPIEVTPIEAFRDKDAPAGYYYSAPEDGSRPAAYYVNTYQPETRPRYTMAALAFHEAVPGHHLQIALAAENKALPRFQREVGLTAFVEGWALYAEGLAGELGLYQTPEEELGALTYEMWRAVRLVVDTGLHARGWTRQQALDYLVAQTGKDPGEAANEIDRYIVWPGQALAYKVGQLEILRLREDARTRLGDRFDLRAFHDEVLAHGAVPLPTLDRLVTAWVGRQ